MQVVLAAQQFGHFRFASSGDQARRGKPPIEQRDDIVALDMDLAVDDQSRHQPARIDAEIPIAEVLALRNVDRMRLPVDTLQIEHDPRLLRTRRAVEVEQMRALPAEHIARLDIALQKPDHPASSRPDSPTPHPCPRHSAGWMPALRPQRDPDRTPVRGSRRIRWSVREISISRPRQEPSPRCPGAPGQCTR